MVASMDTESVTSANSSRQLGRWQFASRHLLAATTGVALVFGMAAWGGWGTSDAVVYLSIVVVTAVFSPTARRVLLGSLTILAAFWLADRLGAMLFGRRGRWVDPRSLWVFAAFLAISATILVRYTKAGALSLVASLLLIEVFLAIVIVYTYGCPTLFEAFDNEHRAFVLQHLQHHFLTAPHGWIIAPWFMGIGLGELWTRHRQAGGH